MAENSFTHFGHMLFHIFIFDEWMADNLFVVIRL